MRFPSVDDAAARARDAAARFPFVILSGVLATGAAWVAVDASDSELWLRLVLGALLGLPLFVALCLAAERRRGRDPTALAAVAAGAVVPFAFFMLSSGWSQTILWTRFFHLALGLHLLVAIVPFLTGADRNAFWQFNRTLFLRFLQAALFTAVLFAGLALALLALDRLFGVDVDGDVYLRLFWLLAFLFSPWFFAAGVPRDFEELEVRRDYPSGLRVFSQFILIPLVTVYLLILSAYLVRILLTRTWPSGWIGWLVSGVAVTGTLALLLVHPLRERADSKWVDAYGRWFYIALLPSVAMLLAAIGQRVGQYGFTERRYFLLVLAVYLAGIAVWYAVTASRNIRIIPAALAVVAFITLAGPWSAYSVSRRSQLARIEVVLERNDMLASDGIRPASQPVSEADRRDVSGSVRYLLATHGPGSLRPLFGFAIEGEPETLRSWQADERAEAILDRLGIRYMPRWANPDNVYFYLNADPTAAATNVAGFDWLLRGDLHNGFVARAGDETLHIRSLPGLLAVSIGREADVIITADLSAFIADRIERYPDMTGRPGVPPDSLEFRTANERASVAIRIEHLSGRREPDGLTLDAVHAVVLITLRPPP
jgi:hypothetical protein